MPGHALTVVDVFSLSDRLVLVTDYVGAFPSYKHGDVVELVSPSGATFRTESWLEISAPSDCNRPFSIGISSDFKPADIPVGTVVAMVSDVE